MCPAVSTITGVTSGFETFVGALELTYISRCLQGKCVIRLHLEKSGVKWRNVGLTFPPGLPAAIDDEGWNLSYNIRPAHRVACEPEPVLRAGLRTP